MATAHEYEEATNERIQTVRIGRNETKYRRTKRTGYARREEGRGKSYVRTYEAATNRQVGEKFPLRTLDAESTIGGAH